MPMLNHKIFDTKFTSHGKHDEFLENVAFLKDKHGKHFTERKVKSSVSPIKIERNSSCNFYFVDLSQKPVNQ